MKSKLTLIFTLFAMMSITFSFAQEKTISGNVTDQNGLPLPGVSVVVVGTGTGTQTDFDGNYSINASTGAVLRFSYVGQKTVNRTVGSQSTISIQMEDDAEVLDEVVVVAYGSQSKDKIVQNVSIVDEEALENLVVTSPDQLLQGQAAGVNVVNTSGLLGTPTNIQVRGVNTINSGSQPLFVIDGVVLTDNSNGFVQGANNGRSANPFSFINPGDIESLVVLKDAGATALYGTRGANGVVLITTKKGKRGQEATVTLNNWVQFTEINDLPEVLTADEYRQFRTDIANIQDGTNLQPQDLGLGAIGDPGSDFVDEVGRTGFTQHTDFSVRGGTENTSYFVSGTFEDAESFAVGNDLTRWAFRVNLDTQATDWLRVGTNVGITNTVLNTIGTENNTFAPFTSALLTNPTFIPRDAAGNFTRSPNFIPNIAAVAALNTNETDNTRIIGSIFGEVSLTPNLKFKSELGVDRQSIGFRLRNADIVTAGGSAFFRAVTDDLYRVTNSLNYTNKFGKHSVNALVLQEFEDRRRRQTQVDGVGFLSDGLTNVGSATTQTVSTTAGGTATRTGSVITGYLSRISYDYDDRYLLELSGRFDRSSRLDLSNNTGTFWSVAGGWTLSNEKFLEDVGFINFLSLRGSVGTSGNDRLIDFLNINRGNFLALGLFGTGQFGGLPSVNVTQAASTNLGFEETRTIDVGFRSSLFNNRLGLNVSYFKRNTTDLLFNVPVPPQTGELDQPINSGELENSGWEFELTADIIRSKDFNWNLRLNVNTLDNEVIAIEAAGEDDQGRRFTDFGASRLREGSPLSQFFLVRAVGVNAQTGDFEWLDVDGNITTTPDLNGDRVDVGKALPDISGGFTHTLNYKNFDLSAAFNYSVGNDILVDGLRFIDGFDAIGGTINVRRQNLNFWRQPGDQAFLPSPASTTANNANQRSTAQLRSGDYLRLKNLTVGYTLPASILDKLDFFSAVRFYGTATNLWTLKGDDLDGIDPENNNTGNPTGLGQSFFTAPQAITYLFGLNLQF